MRLAPALLGLTLALASIGASQAQSVTAPLTRSTKPWNALSESQRVALAPLKEEWAELDDSSREKWLQVAGRFSKLDAEEQARLHERMNAWSRLSPAERLRARVGFQEAQRHSAEERQAKWERYQALSPEQRQALQDRAARRAESGKPAPVHTAAPAGAAPLVVQAKPGVSTVMINSPVARPHGSRAGLRPLQMAGLDPVTLLPAPRPASAP